MTLDEAVTRVKGIARRYQADEEASSPTLDNGAAAHRRDALDTIALQVLLEEVAKLTDPSLLRVRREDAKNALHAAELAGGWGQDAHMRSTPQLGGNAAESRTLSDRYRRRALDLLGLDAG